MNTTRRAFLSLFCAAVGLVRIGQLKVEPMVKPKAYVIDTLGPQLEAIRPKLQHMFETSDAISRLMLKALT